MTHSPFSRLTVVGRRIWDPIFLPPLSRSRVAPTFPKYIRCGSAKSSEVVQPGAEDRDGKAMRQPRGKGGTCSSPPGVRDGRSGGGRGEMLPRRVRHGEVGRGGRSARPVAAPAFGGAGIRTCPAARWATFLGIHA